MVENPSQKINPELKNLIMKFQQTEITEYYVYRSLAKSTKDKNNKSVLEKIAQEELHHSQIWRSYSQTNIQPDGFKIFAYRLAAKIFGLTLAARLMEKGEQNAQASYEKIIDTFPETKMIFDQENQHEDELLKIIKESHLDHIGSIVLGLNDALVELTGALAGLSFALRDTKLIALAGLITGLAASMSMAGSEYLAKKTEDGEHPIKSSVYTGITYVITVILLISPFLIIKNYKIALVTTLVIAMLIILVFTFFSSVVKDKPFKKKFLEMATISFGVATISFLIGMLLRILFNIEV